jgi:hypothetical protein
MHKYITLIGDDHTTDSTGPDSEKRGKREVGYTKLISQKGQSVYESITEKLVEINPIAQFYSIIQATFFLRYYKNFTKIICQFPFPRVKCNNISALRVQLDQAERERSLLIKRSNLMQQYADIYSLQSHSTCFGRRSAHHQEY